LLNRRQLCCDGQDILYRRHQCPPLALWLLYTERAADAGSTALFSEATSVETFIRDLFVAKPNCPEIAISPTAPPPAPPSDHRWHPG